MTLALHYFTGMPCNRGHVAKRLISNATCVVCHRENQRRRYVSHRSKITARKRTHYQANKALRTAWTVARRAHIKLATPSWTSEIKTRTFYVVAGFLNSMGIKVHVDHVVPLRGEHVCGLHVETNLQILLARHNDSKGNKFML